EGQFPEHRQHRPAGMQRGVDQPAGQEREAKPQHAADGQAGEPEEKPPPIRGEVTEKLERLAQRFAADFRRGWTIRTLIEVGGTRHSSESYAQGDGPRTKRRPRTANGFA